MDYSQLIQDIDLKKIHYAILQIRAAIAKAEGR